MLGSIIDRSRGHTRAVMDLSQWLREEAHLHERIHAKILAVLEENEVFEVR